MNFLRSLCCPESHYWITVGGKSTVIHKVIELCKGRVTVGGVLIRHKRLKEKKIALIEKMSKQFSKPKSSMEAKYVCISINRIMRFSLLMVLLLVGLSFSQKRSDATSTTSVNDFSFPELNNQ